MSEKNEATLSEADDDKRSDDTLARLMNLAGPRADIPADIEERVYAAVSRDWRRVTTVRKTVFWAVPAALAATLLIAFAINVRAPDIEYQPVGVIAQVGGQVTGGPFEIGSPVYPGDRIATGPGAGLSVSLFDDVSLRIAANTTVVVNAADAFTLQSGMLYADTGDRIYRDRHLTVETPNGTASDIGTQFAVGYADGLLQVAVREGRVELVSENAVVTAVPGDRLMLQAGRDIAIGKVTPYDESWAWASELAPDFDIENHTLLDFLKWAARETGKSLQFANDDLRMAAMQTELYGSIRNFTPGEALVSVLATTQFEYRIDATSITLLK